jgi:DNA-binding response OmpR family regulator
MTFSANLEGKKVVVIDDSDAWSNLMAAVLKKKGCDVSTYQCHNKYINELREKGPGFCPDCLVVDFHLSGSTEAPEIIKEVKITCDKALILSVSCDFVEDNNVLKTDKMIEALNAGAHRVIPKNINQIVDIMSAHFEVRKTHSSSSSS